MTESNPLKPFNCTYKTQIIAKETTKSPQERRMPSFTAFFTVLRTFLLGSAVREVQEAILGPELACYFPPSTSGINGILRGLLKQEVLDFLGTRVRVRRQVNCRGTSHMRRRHGGTRDGLLFIGTTNPSRGDEGTGCVNIGTAAVIGVWRTSVFLKSLLVRDLRGRYGNDLGNVSRGELVGGNGPQEAVSDSEEGFFSEISGRTKQASTSLFPAAATTTTPS